MFNGSSPLADLFRGVGGDPETLVEKIVAKLGGDIDSHRRSDCMYTIHSVARDAWSAAAKVSAMHPGSLSDLAVVLRGAADEVDSLQRECQQRQAAAEAKAAAVAAEVDRLHDDFEQRKQAEAKAAASV